MSNAQEIINEIWTLLDKFMLKSNKMTNDKLIATIEEKWARADDEKYRNHNGKIIIGRMMNEYSWKKDLDNLLRWMEMDKKYGNNNDNPHPQHIIDNYYARIFLECGEEDLALECLKRAYEENPNMESYCSRPCMKFFNRYLGKAEDNDQNEEVRKKLTFNTVKLEYWKDFFKEECNIRYEVIGKNGPIKRPSAKHKAALEYIKVHQKEILNSMLNELLLIYPELQEIYSYSEEDKQDFMPDVANIYGFSDLLSPTVIYLHSEYKDDFPYIGYSFFCSWDSEHALGIMMNKDEVVEIGDASISFLL